MGTGTATRPVVLIGAARSGTKIVRDILAASPEIVAVPYDVNYIWRSGNEESESDAIGPDRYAEKIGKRIQRQLWRSAGSSPGDGRILLEKTVSNCLRVPFVRQVFPNARFVHLVRDGRDVAESARRMWLAPVDRSYMLKKIRHFPWTNFSYALWFARNRLRGSSLFSSNASPGIAIWGPRYPGIESDLERYTLLEVCARQWQLSVETAATNLGEMAEDEWLEMRYEDFVTDQTAIERVATFVGIRDTAPVLQRYRDEVRSDLGGGWHKLPPEEQQLLEDRLGPTLLRLGYDTVTNSEIPIG